LTFGRLLKYPPRNRELGIAQASVAQKKGIITMPNEQKTPKERIDETAQQAIAKVDKLLADPKAKDLNLELNEIKTSLVTIKGDPHKAQ
jgi:hypothetical protein